jgi:hypothetical protein
LLAHVTRRLKHVSRQRRRLTQAVLPERLGDATDGFLCDVFGVRRAAEASHAEHEEASVKTMPHSTAGSMSPPTRAPSPSQRCLKSSVSVTGKLVKALELLPAEYTRRPADASAKHGQAASSAPEGVTAAGLRRLSWRCLRTHPPAIVDASRNAVAWGRFS